MLKTQPNTALRSGLPPERMVCATHSEERARGCFVNAHYPVVHTLVNVELPESLTYGSKENTMTQKTNFHFGVIGASFIITDMYEDTMLDSPLHNYHPSYIATRAIKR